MSLLWLIFLGILYYVLNRWGEEGGNALWLGGVILILLSALATPLLV